MKKKSLYILGVAIIACLAFQPNAQAVQLPSPFLNIGGIPVSHQYGDFYSYSLPVLEYLRTNGFLPGPSYAVQSATGLIKDDIIIMTGALGGPMVDNSNNGVMDNAYNSPADNPTSFFNTGDSEPAPSFAGDNTNFWDIQLSSLNTYLGGSDLIFLFNHNETGGDQDLYAWGQARIIDVDSVLPTLYFDFTNTPAGGVPVGLPTDYTSSGSGPNPAVFDINNPGDWVLAPGQVTINATNINHNLGENDVAYAAFSPELNAAIHLAGYEVLSADFRLRALNGGAEQLFIQDGHSVDFHIVPEPASLLLWSFGLFGMKIFIRRRRR